jgi:hypothetical protein
VCGVAPLASGEMRSVQCLAVAGVCSLLSGALRCISTHKGVTDTPRASTVCVSPEVLRCAQKYRVVWVHRGVRRCGEAHHALMCLIPVLTRGCGSRVKGLTAIRPNAGFVHLLQLGKKLTPHGS